VPHAVDSRALLYGVEPTDVSTMIVVGSTLLFVAIIVSLVLLRPAARADPMQALSETAFVRRPAGTRRSP
jgi:hypothetical protein